MKTRIVFAMTVGLILFGLTVNSYAELFVPIPGVQGESTEPNHPGWSHALSSSWKHSQGPPESTVKIAQFSQLTVTKTMDTTSGALALFVADARLLPEVLLEFTRTFNNQRLVHLRIRLRNARLVSYEAAGNGNGDLPPTEMLGLTFAQISWATFRYDSSGRQVKGSAACWDVINNVSKCQP